jgi:predicted nucleic-acid-binding protein
MRAIDTNVLVRLITRDHAVQVRVAEDFVMRGAWVSHLVLAEAIWVLTSVYELTPRQVATVLEMLLKHRDLTIQDSDTVARALEAFSARPNLGFSDCLVVAIAQGAGHEPLGTFDRALAKSAGTEHLRAS